MSAPRDTHPSAEISEARISRTPSPILVMFRALSPLRRQAPVGRLANLMSGRSDGFATKSPVFTGKLACLDLEGVLIREVWVNLAERVGVPALKRTTRDEPD